MASTSTSTAMGNGASNGVKKADNPVATWVPAKAHEDPILAYEVPLARRIFQVFVAVAYSLLAAGIVFGYAALKPVLVDEGVYRDRCTRDELRKGVHTCDGQEMR